MLGNGFVNKSAQHDPGRPKLVIEQPTLLRETSAIPHQAAILTDDPVAGDEDRKVVGGDQPAYLAGMKPGCPRNIIIRTGFADREFFAVP